MDRVNTTTALHNWAGNRTFAPARFHRPASIEALRAIVGAAERVRVLGTRHSFNSLPDTPGDLISLDHLDRVLALDPERRSVTIEGGVRYAELGAFLHTRGFALPTLASLPHLSVAGAVATASHGSGDRHAGLASSVSALQLVGGEGQLIECSRAQHGETFHGMVASLGALGVVARLTLDLIPTYLVRQDVYEALPWAELEAHFNAVMAGADSVSLFTDWRASEVAQAWLRRRVDESEPHQPPPTWFGARRASEPRHPILGLSAHNTSPQLGVPGPWHERWPHFAPGHAPSSGDEVQSEYLLPRAHAVEAVRALRALGDRLAPLLLVSEVRTVAADPLWLSPCFGRDCAAFHFTWRNDEAAVREVLPAIEAALAPFEARPHWGKLFTLDPARLRALYPRLEDFRALQATLDPRGKFRNAFLDHFLLG